MTSVYEAKQQIVEIGRRVWTKGWVAANDGNISFKVSDNEFVCTPTGVSKGFMEVGDLLVVDRHARKISGGPLKPSSEIKMHFYVYDQRPDVNAVVHAHPPTSTGFAVAGLSLDACALPEVVALMGQIPLADYGLPSTDEIPKSIDPYIKTNSAVLLANHGALAWGKDLMQAYYRMETMEHFANILLTAVQLGKVNLFTDKQVEALEGLRARFGLSDPFTGCNRNPTGLPAETGKVRDIYDS
ncbi:MAG: class II aldolase/adducin family protein [bacterium]|nr:class II aldolase/adducin family protein [bacterium]